METSAELNHPSLRLSMSIVIAYDRLRDAVGRQSAAAFPARLSGETTELEQTLMEIRLTFIFQKVPEGYIGFVQELPGANTQGTTLDEARRNLQEAVELVLDANRALSERSLQGQDVIREPFLIRAA